MVVGRRSATAAQVFRHEAVVQPVDAAEQGQPCAAHMNAADHAGRLDVARPEGVDEHVVLGAGALEAGVVAVEAAVQRMAELGVALDERQRFGVAGPNGSDGGIRS